tara:strand:- start:123 stop:752 length:630 start_codon:yes stop_codon:yes gene_type:complete
MFNFRNPPNNLLEPLHSLNFLSKEEIDKVFKDLQTIPFEKGKVGDKTKEDNNSVRNSQVKWIPFLKEWEWLYQKLNSVITSANQEAFKLDLKDMNESIQYTEYSSEYDGKYGWHVDLGTEYPSSHRKISTTIQLSSPSEYEGGYLQLFNNSMNPSNPEDQKGLPHYLQNSPKVLGTATLFPSFIPHRVTPVTKGIRKSLVLWVGGTPFK